MINSLINTDRLHPLGKLLFVMIFSIVVLLRLDLKYNTAFLIIGILLISLSGQWFIIFKKFIKPALLMVVSLSLMYAFLSRIPGEVLFIYWPWGTYISNQTAPMCFAVVARIMSLLSCSGWFLMTTTAEQLGAELHRIKVPYSIVFVIELTIEFMQRMRNEWRAVLEGYYSRGMTFKEGNLLQKLRDKGRVARTFMVYALLRANDMSQSAEARGFGMRVRHTSLDEVSWSIRDIFSLAGIGVVVMLAWMLY
jgi:energy-coupling factor transport system permease protein